MLPEAPVRTKLATEMTFVLPSLMYGAVLSVLLPKAEVTVPRLTTVSTEPAPLMVSVPPFRRTGAVAPMRAGLTTGFRP